MRISRRRALVLGAVPLAVALLWAPSVVATRYSNDIVHTDFMGHPLQGWQFLGDALVASRGAEAGTEAHARGIAERRWWSSPIDVTRLELVYVNNRRITIPFAADGVRRSLAARRVRARPKFAWLVHGHAGDRPEQVVGVITMHSGSVVWDLRRRARVATS